MATISMRNFVKMSLTLFLGSSMLVACEKGVYVKDLKITTPDLKLTTQQPGATAGTAAEFEIDFRSISVIPAGTTTKDAWIATANIDLLNKTSGKTKKMTISAQTKMGEVTNGRVETVSKEPMVNWRSQCSKDNCNQFDLVVVLHFYDDQGQFQDLKYVVVSWNRQKQELRRGLLENDIEAATIDKLVKKLRTLPDEQTLTKTDKSKGSENKVQPVGTKTDRNPKIEAPSAVGDPTPSTPTTPKEEPAADAPSAETTAIQDDGNFGQVEF